jgi:hypothetical protein
MLSNAHLVTESRDALEYTVAGDFSLEAKSNKKVVGQTNGLRPIILIRFGFQERWKKGGISLIASKTGL